jgi:spoIIIJ-associated protein
MPRSFDPEHERDPRASGREGDDLLPDPDDDIDLEADSDDPDSDDANADDPDDSSLEEDLGEPEVAEAVGATVEEAIENALEILGAREDEVDIEVLDHGHRPLFGIGRRRPFRVRATWREDLDEEVIEEEVSPEESASAKRPVHADPPAPAPRPSPTQRPVAARAFPAPPERPIQPYPPAGLGGEPAPSLAALSALAREVTEDLLRRMGVQGIVRAEPREGEVHVDIESEEDEALLIGHRGEARAALQHIVQRLVTPRDERGTPVLVDVNGYWSRRVEQLRSEALDLARDALAHRQEVRTEPLSAQERRVVHRALAGDDRVTTESLGEGALKRVAILPAGMAS